jgi:hypothetical protein
VAKLGAAPVQECCWKCGFFLTKPVCTGAFSVCDENFMLWIVLAWFFDWTFEIFTLFFFQEFGRKEWGSE